ncbi:hypothetical protein [Sphingobium aromaticiconvertens]|uniref:hypothetical protein n=1 Tax=Sphingobium aromaticiconvertens TaxID=365341 RepID=UPI0030178BB5
MKRNTAVAYAMFMPTFEAIAWLAQKNRARHERRRPFRRSIFEAAFDDDCHANLTMFLFESRVMGTSAASHVRGRPTIAKRDEVCRNRHQPNIAIFPKSPPAKRLSQHAMVWNKETKNGNDTS